MSLLFEDKVPQSYRAPFVAKVKQIAQRMGIPANWLMGVMELETAGTFSPSIQNSIKATGLIQFIPSTAIGLGTTVDELKRMTAVRQLDYVEAYYQPYRKKIKRYADLYIATLLPIALGKPDGFVLKYGNVSASTIARANPLFDLNKDGKITVREIEMKLLQRIPVEWLNIIRQKKNG